MKTGSFSGLKNKYLNKVVSIAQNYSWKLKVRGIECVINMVAKRYCNLLADSSNEENVSRIFCNLRNLCSTRRAYRPSCPFFFGVVFSILMVSAFMYTVIRVCSHDNRRKIKSPAHPATFCVVHNYVPSLCRPVVGGGAGGARAHPEFLEVKKTLQLMCQTIII